jgi:hypothetical protein
MPCSYPQRISFMYAAVCVCIMIHQGICGKKLTQLDSLGQVFAYKMLPLLAVFLGIGCSAIICVFYEAYSGYHFVIFSFVVIMAVNTHHWNMKQSFSYDDRMLLHQFNMIALVVFGCFGVLQSFGWALLQYFGISCPFFRETEAEYTGNQAIRSFDWRNFVGSFVVFAFFSIAGTLLWWVFRRFRIKRRYERMQQEIEDKDISSYELLGISTSTTA